MIQDVSFCIIATLQHTCHWLTQATHGHTRSSTSLFMENPNSRSSVKTRMGLRHFFISSVLLQSCDSASLHTATKRNRMSIDTQTEMSILLGLTYIPSLPLGLLILLTKPTQPNAQERGKMDAESDKRYSSDRIMTRYIGRL